MTDPGRTSSSYDKLIGQLVRDLSPVQRAMSPARSLAIWIAAVAALAAVTSFGADLPAVWARLTGASDMWLATIGSLATAVLAAFAAFQLGLPDRTSAWALLPLPALVLWLGASGLGCLRSWVVPGVPTIPLDHIKQCFFFIAGFSIPISALLLILLRKGYSLYPSTNAALAGLAAAAAAATLLTLVHPFDATALDLSVHFMTVALVVVANRSLGGVLLHRR